MNIHRIYFHQREYWLIFIEDQAFSRSYDLAPSPPLPPFPSVSLEGDTEEDWEREATCLQERREGEKAKSIDRKKAWSSINHWILSDFHYSVPASPLMIVGECICPYIAVCHLPECCSPIHGFSNYPSAIPYYRLQAFPLYINVCIVGCNKYGFF